MLTFPKVKFMRKYRTNLFYLLRKVKPKRSIKKFFFHVYKEQTQTLFTIKYICKKKKRIYKWRRIKRLFYFNRQDNVFFNDRKRYHVKRLKKHEYSLHGYWLATYKNFMYFYNNLSPRIFKRLWERARRGHVFFLNYFLFLLESRIDSLLIRVNWVKTKHMIRQYLRKKYFLINNKIMTFANYIIPKLHFLSLKKEKRKDLFFLLRRRFRKHYVFSKPPVYVELNNRTFTCLLIQALVTRKRVRFPFGWDIDGLLYLFYNNK